MDDAIEQLNALARESIKGQVPLRTTKELLDFFKNPPKRGYSVPLEEAMTAVVKLFGVADDDNRHSITSRLSEHARKGFLGYAAAMAVLAVKDHSPALIQQGLIALIIEGGSQDWRDSIVALSNLYNSAVKLGMNATQVFEEAARLAEPGIMKAEINGFLFRRREGQNLQSFHEAEEITEEGVRYKQVLPRLLPQDTTEETKPVESSQQISARLNRDQQNALIQMAGTLAVMAIRMQSPKLVEQGLQGLALAGALEPSYCVAALAKLHHSALKLGMNAEVAFAEAARLAPPGNLQTEMTGFPLREPKDRDLAAFNLQVEITEKGFGYKRVP